MLSFNKRFINFNHVYMKENDILEKYGLKTSKKDCFTKTNVYNYTRFINDSQQCRYILDNFLQDFNQFSLIAADTGAGKTYAIVDAFNRLDYNKVKDYDCYEENKRKIINILCVPSRSQAIQVSEQYSNSNIACIVGGVSLNNLNFDKDINNYVVVYDKIVDFINFFRQKDITFFQKHKFNLILDEAHNLIFATYRQNTINNILDFIQYLKIYGNNIAVMSASFEVLNIFDVNNVICFAKNTQNEEEINTKTSIIVRQKDKNGNYNQNEIDFITNNILKVLQENKKVYISYQRKDKEESGFILTNIVKEIEKTLNRKVTWGCLNSDLKEINENGDYLNEDINTLVKNSAILDKDIIFATSMVDAGTNILGVLQENGDILQDKNVVLMYVVDGQRYVIDDIEQSFNRFRYEVNERIVLLASENILNIVDLKDFNAILNEQLEKLSQIKEDFQAGYDIMKKYGQKVSKNDLLNRIENADEEIKIAKSLYFDDDNEEIKINKIEAYRICKEIYYKQALNEEVLELFLRDRLDGTIQYQDENLNEINVNINIESQRQEIFNQLLENKQKLDEFLQKTGDIFNSLRNSNLLKTYKLIDRYNENVSDTIEILANASNKELNNYIKYYTLQDIYNLDDINRKAIEYYLKPSDKKLSIEEIKIKNEILNNCDYTIVNNIIEGIYSKEIKILLENDYYIDDIKEYAGQGNKVFEQNVEQAKAKAINKRYKNGIKPVLKVEKEQYKLLITIAKLSQNTKTFTLTDNNIDKIIEKMGQNYTKNKIIAMCNNVFKTKNDGNYTIIYKINL